MKPVCLIIGAGAGIGGNVAKKFASEGYHSYLCRRTDAPSTHNDNNPTFRMAFDRNMSWRKLDMAICGNRRTARDPPSTPRKLPNRLRNCRRLRCRNGLRRQAYRGLVVGSTQRET